MAMSAARQHLHTLVDVVDEIDLDTLNRVLVRFIPEDDPMPDETEAIARAAEARRRGDMVTMSDINWN